MSDQGTDLKVNHVRALAADLGLLVRSADHQAGGWHIVNPAIDDKVYAFAFTKPHTFSLDEVERILSKRVDLARGMIADDPD